MSYNDDQKHLDYLFFVHNALEVYLAEYLVECDKAKYDFMKSKLRTMAEEHLSREEIEELFKGY